MSSDHANTLDITRSTPCDVDYLINHINPHCLAELRFYGCDNYRDHLSQPASLGDIVLTIRLDEEIVALYGYNYEYKTTAMVTTNMSPTTRRKFVRNMREGVRQFKQITGATELHNYVWTGHPQAVRLLKALGADFKDTPISQVKEFSLV